MPDDPGERDPGEPSSPEQFVIHTLLSGRPTPLGAEVRIDAGDDTAVLADGTLVTTDTLVEGVHWDHRATAEDVGWKAVAVSVSDIAAMGGHPTWATLSVCLPRPLDAAWVHGFARGVHAACARWSVHVVGGDTTRSPGPRVVSVTLAGHALHPVSRCGAQPGHDIWVTGVPGEAAVGFQVGGAGLTALHRPAPPLELAGALAELRCVSAMMDLSDGLATDLPRLCHRSGVGARVDPRALPVSPVLAALPDPLAAQVAFGDDYQLLFTAAPAHRSALARLADLHGVRLTRIGEAVPGTVVELIGRPWPRPLFRHFSPALEAQA